MQLGGTVRAYAMLAVGASAMLVMPAPAEAQWTAPADTLLEVFGLEEWTVDQVEDSLSRIRPGLTLADAACAVILRDSLGFADAAVETWIFRDTVVTTVTVIEPHDSSKIAFLPTRSDSLSDRQSWQPLIAGVRDQFWALSSAFQQYAFLRGSTDSVFGEMPDSVVIRIRDNLAAEAAGADYDQLLWTLRHDQNDANRAVATLLLAHFPYDDRTWWALAGALRGRGDRGTTMALVVLPGMARERTEPVNWAGALQDLEFLIAGTNLFAWLRVLNVLENTKIDLQLAQHLVSHGTDLLGWNLDSKNRSRRRQAQAFLIAAGAVDFGEDSEAWRQWLADFRR